MIIDKLIYFLQIGLVISKEGLGKFFDANIERMTVNMEKRMFDMVFVRTLFIIYAISECTRASRISHS
jgi:hypothetical protein